LKKKKEKWKEELMDRWIDLPITTNAAICLFNFTLEIKTPGFKLN